MSNVTLLTSEFPCLTLSLVLSLKRVKALAFCDNTRSPDRSEMLLYHEECGNTSGKTRDWHGPLLPTLKFSVFLKQET